MHGGAHFIQIYLGDNGLMERIIDLSRERTDVFEAANVLGQKVYLEAGADLRPENAVGVSPMELMLAALAGCSAATLEEVITKMRHRLLWMRLAVDAERANRVPRIWTEIVLNYVIRTDLPRSRLSRAVDVAERTCSAMAMIASSATISHRVVSVEPVDPETTRPLRQRLLRPHQSIEELVVAGESDPGAVWFAAFEGDEVVGTAGVIPEPSPSGETGMVLRAMATSEKARGLGVGAALVDAAKTTVLDNGLNLLWCRARTPAEDFYSHHGFETISQTYEQPGTGPHVTMEWRQLVTPDSA